MHHPERRREESLDGQSYTTIDREMGKRFYKALQRGACAWSLTDCP